MHKEKHFTQAINSMPTEREMEEYISFLEISENDLKKWRTILDLGAGTAQEFSREYSKRGYGGTVISLDPNLGIPWSQEKTRYLEEEYAHRLKGRNQAHKNTVAGLSQSLPFKNDSFDAILALYSVPKWVIERKDIIDSIREMVRVIKNNGEVRIYPVHETINKEIIEETLTEIDTISFEFILKETLGKEKKWLLIIKKFDNGL